MENLFTKKHQMEALKNARDKYPELQIGASYVSLINYEETGVVNLPKYQLQVNDRLWRFYTAEEIQDNVNRVIAYKKEQLSKRKHD